MQWCGPGLSARIEVYLSSLVNKPHIFLLYAFADLLRRLSRTQQTVFCGRILLFLARFFPITERSGLNVVSEFNLDNTTVYSERNDLELDENATIHADGDDEAKEAEKMEIEADHKE